MRNQVMNLAVSAMLLTCIVVFGGHCTASAAVPGPTDQLRPFLDNIVQLMGDQEFKTLSSAEQGQRLLTLVKERFDFKETSKRVLGQHWRKLKPEEQEEFVELFTRFLKDVYVEKIDDSSSGEHIEYTGQRIGGGNNDRAEVQTVLVDSKKKPISIRYIMLLKGDKWLIYDVVAEDVSLIRNYAEQFQDVLKKGGYPGLVNQIKEKIRQLEEKEKGV